MSDTFKERKLRVSFFNSTPQGGGGKLPRILKKKACDISNLKKNCK
jgi:hypothetical protein